MPRPSFDHSSRAPLWPLALGTWIGCAFPAPQPAWLVVPALFAARPRLAQIALGVLLGSWLQQRTPLPLCPSPETRAEWLGRVVEIAPERDGRTSLLVDIDGQRTDSRLLSCPALISAGRRPPEVIEGDAVWLPELTLSAPIHLVNPGVGDSAEALIGRGIARVGSLPDGAGILALAHGNPFERWRGWVRARARVLFGALPATEARAVVFGLALGERSQLDPDTLDAFQDSGLRHLLTLGVLYLSAWLGLFALIFAFFWRRSEQAALALPARRAAALFGLPLPFLYAVVGEGLSASKAALLGALLLAALGLGRGRPSALHLLSLALLTLLAVSPATSRAPGLFWSVAAALGIWLFAHRWLAGPLHPGILGALRDHLVRALAVGVAAFLATAPLQLLSEHRWALMTIPLSLVGLLAAVPAALLAQSAVLLGNATLLRTALLPAAALARLAHAGRRFGVALSLPGLLAGHPDRLRLTFLSVGHGDSTVIETPHGHTILIDGGGSVVGDFDPGRQIVLPYLRARGIRSLDAVILSHPHPDHANGLPAVFRGLQVDEFWHSDEPCPLPACAELQGRAPDLTLGSAPFVRTIDGVRFELLSRGYRPWWGPNDNSLVFRVSYGSFHALLTGDIEAPAEAELLASNADLAADLLKAPHHGSDTSSTSDFVARVRPRFVVFSVGPRNRFDFPRPSVVERYRGAGAATFRTDLDGAVTVETDGSAVRVFPTVPRE